MSRQALQVGADPAAPPIVTHDGMPQPAHPSQGSRARRGPAAALALLERAHAASSPRFVSSVLVVGGLCVGLVALATCTQP